MIYKSVEQIQERTSAPSLEKVIVWFVGGVDLRMENF